MKKLSWLREQSERGSRRWGGFRSWRGISGSGRNKRRNKELAARISCFIANPARLKRTYQAPPGPSVSGSELLSSPYLDLLLWSYIQVQEVVAADNCTVMNIHYANMWWKCVSIAALLLTKEIWSPLFVVTSWIFALTFATAASRVRCRCCNRCLRFWSNFSW